MSEILHEIQNKAFLSGTVDETVRWIEEKQLLDAPLWAKFVNEFRIQEDSNDGAWRGEYWGKMMRGAVTVYKYTRNPSLYETLEATVKDMLTAADSEGRISTYRKERELFSWDIWCRKYVMLGMEFFLEICENSELRERITDCLCLECDYLCDRIGNEPGMIKITDTSGIWGGMNSSSILEPVVRLYKLTGKDRYFKLSEHIISCGGSNIVNIFEAAYKNEHAPYQYGISKAYEMMSCFEGLLEYYYITGDEKAKETVVKFAHKVLETDISVIGSAGCTHELFDNSANRQTVETDGLNPDARIMQETCVTVTWMKLCRKIYMLTGEAVFGDALERSFYNAYLGSLNKNGYADERAKKDIAEGRAIYTFLPFDSYSPLTKGVRGIRAGGYQILADKTYYGCCACIASAGAGLFANSQILGTDSGILINGFEDGKIYFTTPETGSACLSFEGGYPYGDGNVRITLHAEIAAKFNVSVRSAVKAVYNGIVYLPENGFIKIDSTWKDGDVIILTFDTSLHVTKAPVYAATTIYVGWNEKTPKEVYQTEDEKKMISLSRGPVVLAMDRSLTGDIDSPASPLPCHSVHGRKSENFKFITEIETADRGAITFCDYASAGRSWNTDTEMCAWFKEE